MKLTKFLAAFLLIFSTCDVDPSLAQSTAAQVVPGYLTTSGCPSGQTVCFVQYGTTSGPGGTVNQGTGGTSAWLIQLCCDANGTPLTAPLLGVQTAANGQAVTLTTGSTVQAIAGSTGGASMYSANVTTTAASVDASPGQIYWYYIGNTNSSACYLQVFDVASGSVTVGTTTPTLSLMIPASSSSVGGANSGTFVGLAFSTAISIASTTTRTGSSACTNGLDVNIGYK